MSKTELRFELKATKHPNIAVSLEAETPQAALALYLETVNEWESIKGQLPPAPKGSAAKAEKLVKEGQSETEQQDAQPAAPTELASKRQQKKSILGDLNQNALELADRVSLMVPEFAGQLPYDVVEALGFKKPMATMDVNELSDVIKAMWGLCQQYAAANPDAAAYLEIAQIIKHAESLEDLESKKNSFTKWKELSKNERLFNAAKRDYEDKKTCFMTAGQLVEALVS